jgi:hypothetical protein
LWRRVRPGVWVWSGARVGGWVGFEGPVEGVRIVWFVQLGSCVCPVCVPAPPVSFYRCLCASACPVCPVCALTRQTRQPVLRPCTALLLSRLPPVSFYRYRTGTVPRLKACEGYSTGIRIQVGEDCSDERTPPSTSPRPRHGGHRRPKGAGRSAPGVPASGELRLTPLGATSARRGITFPRPRLEALILFEHVQVTSGTIESCDKASWLQQAVNLQGNSTILWLAHSAMEMKFLSPICWRGAATWMLTNSLRRRCRNLRGRRARGSDQPTI